MCARRRLLSSARKLAYMWQGFSLICALLVGPIKRAAGLAAAVDQTAFTFAGSRSGGEALAFVAADIVEGAGFHLRQFDIRHDHDLRSVTRRARDLHFGEVHAVHRMRYAGLLQNFAFFHFFTLQSELRAGHQPSLYQKGQRSCRRHTGLLLGDVARRHAVIEGTVLRVEALLADDIAAGQIAFRGRLAGAGQTLISY
jgi:hypothetical protein